MVRQDILPILLGSPTPTAIVLEQDGRYRIRELVVDRNRSEAALASAARARTVGWVPAHYQAAGQPTGRILAKARTREDLLALIRTMDWPEDW